MFKYKGLVGIWVTFCTVKFKALVCQWLTCSCMAEYEELVVIWVILYMVEYKGVDWDLSHLVMTRVCTCHAIQHLKGVRAYVFPLIGLVCQCLTWLCMAKYRGGD